SLFARKSTASNTFAAIGQFEWLTNKRTTQNLFYPQDSCPNHDVFPSCFQQHKPISSKKEARTPASAYRCLSSRFDCFACAGQASLQHEARCVFLLLELLLK
ncbi:MAG: hypothetical protein AAGJ35_14910, partial [Myxococcota bacterium]